MLLELLQTYPDETQSVRKESVNPYHRFQWLLSSHQVQHFQTVR